MYRHTPSYVWVDWQWEGESEPADGHDYTGFRARILRNPNASQVRAEQDAFRAWLEADRDAASRDEYYQLIAPRIVAWEYELPDEGGEYVPVPAPGSSPDNWSAITLLPLDLGGWLIHEVRLAHVPKVTTPASPPAGTTEQASPNETSPEPALPAS